MSAKLNTRNRTTDLELLIGQGIFFMASSHLKGFTYRIILFQYG